MWSYEDVQVEGLRDRNRDVQVNNVQRNCEYAFHISGDKFSTISVNIGEVKLVMLVNSGVTSNILSEETREALKAQKIQCKSGAAPPIGRNGCMHMHLMNPCHLRELSPPKSDLKLARGRPKQSFW